MNPRYTRSQQLFNRASEVIPGGIYGHAAPAATVPGEFPYFAERADGCRYWDADGHEYIDFMCGFGPILLGYNNEEVNEVTRAIQARGDCFNHPTELTVELAETLTQTIDCADWAVFGKNGTDATSWSLRVAREHTARKRIAKVNHAYHGVDPWCVPGFGGIIAEDRAQIDHFKWNDTESLNRVFEKHADDLAAVMITPFHHPAFDDSEVPSPEFVEAINTLTQKHGTLLIIDDVRCGFRLHEEGSHKLYGLCPDLICFSKAIANGYPLSACVGLKSYKVAASKCFLTGSFWNSAVPVAAALETIKIALRENVVAALAERGTQLIDGMIELGLRHGIPLQASGPPAMPYVRVAQDPSFQKQQVLCTAAATHGLYLHPHHNWFLSAAHKKADIDEALQRFDATLKVSIEKLDQSSPELR